MVSRKKGEPKTEPDNRSPLVLCAYFLDLDRTKARDPHNAKDNEVVDIDKIIQGGEDDTLGKDGRTSFLG
jgi:hypothetical protein